MLEMQCERQAEREAEGLTGEYTEQERRLWVMARATRLEAWQHEKHCRWMAVGYAIVPALLLMAYCWGAGMYR